MLPFAEQGGDPIDVVQMFMMLVDMRWLLWYRWHSLIPFENILSSRDYSLSFKSSFCKETPQMAFLSEHVAILGYLCLAEYIPYSPLFCWLLNCCRAWHYRCRWLLHWHRGVAWGSHSAVWDSRISWYRWLSYGLLVLLLLAVSNSLCCFPLRDVLMGQWPLCVIFWIFTRIRVVLIRFRV